MAIDHVFVTPQSVLLEQIKQMWCAILRRKWAIFPRFPMIELLRIELAPPSTADRWRCGQHKKMRPARHESAMRFVAELTCKLSVSWLFLVITENLRKYKVTSNPTLLELNSFPFHKNPIKNKKNVRKRSIGHFPIAWVSVNNENDSEIVSHSSQALNVENMIPKTLSVPMVFRVQSTANWMDLTKNANDDANTNEIGSKQCTLRGSIQCIFENKSNKFMFSIIVLLSVFAVHKCWWNLVWLAHRKVMDCSRRKPTLCRCDSVKFWAKSLRWIIYTYFSMRIFESTKWPFDCRQKLWWAKWWRKLLSH